MQNTTLTSMIRREVSLASSNFRAPRHCPARMPVAFPRERENSSNTRKTTPAIFIAATTLMPRIEYPCRIAASAVLQKNSFTRRGAALTAIRRARSPEIRNPR